MGITSDIKNIAEICVNPKVIACKLCIRDKIKGSVVYAVSDHLIAPINPAKISKLLEEK